MSSLTGLRNRLATEGGALALLGAGLLFLLLVLVPLARQVESLAREIEAPETNAAESAGDPTSRRFLRSLPDPVRRDKELSRLPETARAHGLTVGQMGVDDPVVGDGSIPLSSLTGRIVVEGSYEAIRLWLADTVTASPGLAIGALQIAPAPNREPARVARLDFVFHAAPATSGNPADGPMAPSLPATTPSVPVLDPFSLPATRRAADRRTAPAPEPLVALPYTYGGSLRSAGPDIYLLIDGDQVIRARIGDTLPGGLFRLDEASAARLVLTHLPSEQRLYLSIGNH